MRLRVMMRVGLILGMMSMSVGSSVAGVPAGLMTGSQAVPSLAPMLQQVTPAVVNISTFTHVRRVNPLLQDPFFRRFFNLPDQRNAEKSTRKTQSAGSGVIVDAENGLIMTNHHVIEGADEIQVTLQDGRTLAATFKGSDKQMDIALLQIEAEQLHALRWVDSSTLAVGDFVVAIGNPFGLGQTVTSGIVSALGRSGVGIYGFEDFIQTDASINPGNSGGALVNLKGELIGINSAIIGPGGGNVGIGFAIPAEIAHNVMTQLLEFGEVRRGQLGVIYQSLTADLAEAFGLDTPEGALVVKVAPGTPAESAGLLQGDVIVEVNGRKVRNSVDFRNRLGLTPVGTAMHLVVLRSGNPVKLTAVVGARSEFTQPGSAFHPMLAGVWVRNFYRNESDEESIAVEVAKLDENSLAAQEGLREGDIIVSASRYRVRNMTEMAKALKNSDQLLLRIEREGRGYFLTIR